MYVYIRMYIHIYVLRKRRDDCGNSDTDFFALKLFFFTAKFY